MCRLDWELLGGVEKSGFLREGRAGARGGKACKQKGTEVTLAPIEADGDRSLLPDSACEVAPV